MGTAQMRDTSSGFSAPDRWLTAAQAANHIGVQVATLAKWRLRSFGPAYSCSLRRDPRYRLSELDSFMAGSMAANTTEAKAMRQRQGHYSAIV